MYSCGLHHKFGWPARTYLPQLCTDTGYRMEDQPGGMDDKGSGKSMLTWWCWWYIYIYIVWEREQWGSKLSTIHMGLVKW